MFRIDTLLESFNSLDLIPESEEDLTVEEKENIEKARNLAVEISKALMEMGYAIQGYDEEYRNLIPDARRKANYSRAAAKLKRAVEKGGTVLKDGTLYDFPEFRVDVNQWKMLKAIAEDPEKMFTNPGGKGAKVAKELVKLAVDIKKRNWVKPSDTSASGFAKDLADKDNFNQQNRYANILSKIKTADYEYDEPETAEDRKEEKDVGKGLADLVRNATRDKKVANKTRIDYLKDIRNARKNGTEAARTVGKMVDKTGVGAGVRTKGLDEVRQSEVNNLKKDNSINLKDPKETGFDFKGIKYKNIKKLVEAWKGAGIPMNGQIKIISLNNRYFKPIVEVDGQLYIIPRNDLVNNSRGGIATADSPYKGYTTSATKDPKYNDLREKIK